MKLPPCRPEARLLFPKGLGLPPGAKFYVVGSGDTIILKRLELPSKDELKDLLSQSRKAAKKSKAKKEDVEKIIRRER